MRLKDEKPSINFRDLSWVPLRYVSPDKKGTPYRASPEGSLEGNPFGTLLPDEIEMLKSGASLEELLFMRAMHSSPDTFIHPPLKKKRK